MICTHYGATALIGPGPPHYRGYTLHSDTPHLVGLLWTSDQRPLPDNTQHSQERDRDIHALGWIRTRNSSKRAAADPHIKPCGQRDRLSVFSHQIVFGLSNQE